MNCFYRTIPLFANENIYIHILHSEDHKVTNQCGLGHDSTRVRLYWVEDNCANEINLLTHTPGAGSIA